MSRQTVWLFVLRLLCRKCRRQTFGRFYSWSLSEHPNDSFDILLVLYWRERLWESICRYDIERDIVSSGNQSNASKRMLSTLATAKATSLQVALLMRIYDGCFFNGEPDRDLNADARSFLSCFHSNHFKKSGCLTRRQGGQGQCWPAPNWNSS